MGQTLQSGAVGVGLEDVHIRIEIPLIAAPPAGALFLFAMAVFLGVMLLGVGIKMAAGENDFLAVRREVTAGRPPDAGTDPAVLPGVEVHDKNLIERVA